MNLSSVFRRTNLRYATSLLRAAAFALALWMAAITPAVAVDTSNSPFNTGAYKLQVAYLDEASHGLYEVQYNNDYNLVMTAAIDRVQDDQDLGYVYAFDQDSMELKWRLDMPHRAYVLAQDREHGKLFVGFAMNSGLSIARVDIKSGKIEKTGPRLQVQPADFEGIEHFRHMVYVPANRSLYTGYGGNGQSRSGAVKDGQRLLVISADTLQVTGEVEGGFPDGGHAISFDEDQGLIFTGGKSISMIDPLTNRVERTLDLQDCEPAAENILSIAVDNRNKRIFAAQNMFRTEGQNDGVYVLDFEGRQQGFVRTGQGAIAVSYNPVRDEAYVSNFRVGTVSVIDGKTLQVTHNFNAGPLPNQMAFDPEGQRLFVGLKEVYSPRSSTGTFITGARERLLKVDIPEAE